MDMEWAMLESVKKGHQAIETSIKDLAGLGYLISGIKYTATGDLEITCRPPKKEGGSQG
jgi:hypothetical protein